jgi:hypothetical protein
MQATACFHDGIPHPVLQKAAFILDAPVAFPPTNGLFHPHSAGRKTTMHGLLRGRAFSSRRVFLGLNNCDVRQEESLDVLRLIQTAPSGHGRGSELCQALLRGVTCSRVAQEAHGTSLVDHEEGFERVTLLLAAVRCLLFCGIRWTVARTFSALMPQRGGVDLPSVACVWTSAATSAAVRAGRRSWAAQA